MRVFSACLRKRDREGSNSSVKCSSQRCNTARCATTGTLRRLLRAVLAFASACCAVTCAGSSAVVAEEMAGLPLDKFDLLLPRTRAGSTEHLSALPAVPTVIHLFTG